MDPELRAARPSDVDQLLALMREFYAGAGYPFDAPEARRALSTLLTTPSLGRAWLLGFGGEAVGYLVLTLGYSLEYGGRDAFVDELFVRPPARGRGLGRAALEHALAEATRAGVRAVHLEVERGNPSARALYRAVGFRGNDRALLTRRLGPHPEIDGAR